MKSTTNHDLVVRLYGHDAGKALINTEIWQCGACKDGIRIDDGNGSWLIAFTDLKRIYLQARRRRARK